MSARLRLLLVVAIATTFEFLVAGCVAFGGLFGVLVASSLVVGALIVLRRVLGFLRANYKGREVRSITGAFGLCSPASLVVAILLGELAGGLAGIEGPILGLIGAVLGTLMIAAMMNSLAVLASFWLTRYEESVVWGS